MTLWDLNKARKEALRSLIKALEGLVKVLG